MMLLMKQDSETMQGYISQSKEEDAGNNKHI